MIDINWRVTRREKLANEIRGGNIDRLVGRPSNMPIESYKIPIHRIISQAEPMRSAARFRKLRWKHHEWPVGRPAKAVLHFTESLLNLAFDQFQGDERESRHYIFEAQCRALHFYTTWNLTETRQRNRVNLKDLLIFVLRRFLLPLIFCLIKVIKIQ